MPDLRKSDFLDQKLNCLISSSGNEQLAQEALRLHPDCRPAAADPTQSIFEVRHRRDRTDKILWARSNSAYLTFDGLSFTGVISGFILRVLSDIFQGLTEQYRVLKPGGRIAVLDTSNPLNTC